MFWGSFGWCWTILKKGTKVGLFFFKIDKTSKRFFYAPFLLKKSKELVEIKTVNHEAHKVEWTVKRGPFFTVSRKQKK